MSILPYNAFEHLSTAGDMDGASSCCRCDGGYWRNIQSGIVFDCREGGSGSVPRDAYEDDPEWAKRSALHEEVMEPLRMLLELQADSRATLSPSAARQARIVKRQERHRQREKAIRALMDALHLTDHAGTY